jgi:hypothetical protein
MSGRRAAVGIRDLLRSGRVSEFWGTKRNRQFGFSIHQRCAIQRAFAIRRDLAHWSWSPRTNDLRTSKCLNCRGSLQKRYESDGNERRRNLKPRRLDRFWLRPVLSFWRLANHARNVGENGAEKEHVRVVSAARAHEAHGS